MKCRKRAYKNSFHAHRFDLPAYVCKHVLREGVAAWPPLNLVLRTKELLTRKKRTRPLFRD